MWGVGCEGEIVKGHLLTDPMIEVLEIILVM